MLHLWFSFYTGRAFVQVPESAKMLPCVQWHFNLTVLRPGKWGWEPGLSAEAMESSELLCTFPLGISDSCWWFWTVDFSVFHLQGEEHSLLTKICWFWNSERDLFFFFLEYLLQVSVPWLLERHVRNEIWMERSSASGRTHLSWLDVVIKYCANLRCVI